MAGYDSLARASKIQTLEVSVAKRRAPSLEEIAGEVGRLFGTTEAHARRWLQQRNAMLAALHLVRGKATELIDELSGENPRRLKRMSAATRAKMRAAARKRWAGKKKNG